MSLAGGLWPSARAFACICGDVFMGALGSDRSVIQQVNQRLASRGIRNPCKIDVAAKNGEVTLTGNIQYPHQRAAAMQAASTAAGVRHVIDRLVIKAAVKRT